MVVNLMPIFIMPMLESGIVSIFQWIYYQNMKLNFYHSAQK